MGATFIGPNRHILVRRPRVLRDPIEPRRPRGAPCTTRRSASSPTSLAAVLAFVSPYITIAICAACAVYYSLPIASRAGDGGQSEASIA